MSGKRFKTPSGGKQNGLKAPSTTSPKVAAEGIPIFCFAYLQKGYGIEDLEKSEKVYILDELDKMRQLSWIRWQSIDKTQGFEKVPLKQLTPKPPPDFADREQVYVKRFSDVGRIIGFREGDIFHIVWIARKKIY